MKRAVKWTSTDINTSGVDEHRPDRKEKDDQCRPDKKGSGRRPPRKVQWSTSTAFFMTYWHWQSTATSTAAFFSFGSRQPFSSCPIVEPKIKLRLEENSPHYDCHIWVDIFHRQGYLVVQFVMSHPFHPCSILPGHRRTCWFWCRQQVRLVIFSLIIYLVLNY